jgi:Ser/Thr protein kinase RdoA (MazF antagonist)
VRSDIHDRRWHEELLAPYGLQLVADPKPVSFGARNAHTVLHTSDGAMVLRRYRGGWHLDTVLHEHAVLRRLAELDFPAVRVVTTSDGATFVRRGEQLFALFERSPGISYWSTFMTHRGRQRLHREAGRTLGVMHTALRGYVPDVEHHVNIQAASSGDASGVEWHLAALEWLTSTTGDDEYAHPHERDLVARAWYATQRLVDLDTTLQRADLPRVMIHGDYGLHNLLFADDGSAIVCDFELARLDLRLVDLVIAMSRIIVESGRSFLHGYCSAAPIPPDELRLLPTVWQFYHLTAAVRSWHNYRTIAGIERLATARRRLIEAERVHREGLVPRA